MTEEIQPTKTDSKMKNARRWLNYQKAKKWCPGIALGLLIAIAGINYLVQPKQVKHVALPDGGTIRLRYCPAGSFMMGSPDWEDGRQDRETRHRVTLKKGFWMGETEVTQGQWKEVMFGETIYDLARKALHDDTEYWPSQSNKTIRAGLGLFRNSNPALACAIPDDSVPIYYVSWAEAARFCAMLTESERTKGRLPRGYEYRLPTEAEWEYACRAGSSASLPNGKEIVILGERNAPALDDIAWYGGNSSLDYSGGGPWKTDAWVERQYPVGDKAGPHPVAQKRHNAFGLYDMLGNVWEWCNDYAGAYEKESETTLTDPLGPSAGRWRIVRGGSWSASPSNCRSATRECNVSTCRDCRLGFRIVLAPTLTRND